MKYSTRKQNFYTPNSKKPFALSRSKIELFMQCKRCFYLDRRLGVAPPSSFPFNLNQAVDTLLKKEFDKYRELQEIPKIVKENGLSLIPFKNEKMDEWRDVFKGVRYLDEDTNFEVFGGVDDIWTDGDKIFVVDYKATSKDGEVSIDSNWQISYKRQMEIYQWLLTKNGFNVSPVSYFVYSNAKAKDDEFNDRLNFDTKLIEYKGDSSWVDSTLKDIKDLLDKNEIPKNAPFCELCNYRECAGKSFIDFVNKNK